MAVPPVTPIAGAASEVITGGLPVVAVLGGPNGGYIVNPLTVADQGIGGSDPEPLFVNPVTSATLNANDTTFRLEPGQSWELIPGQVTPTSVNASSNGHKFSVVSF